jgi:hypothetical protein
VPAQMTSTAWGQRFKNALMGCLLVPVFLVLMCAFAVAISRIFDLPIFTSFGLTISILSLLILLASLFHGWTVAGRVLLDCGPNPTRILSLIGALMFLGMGSNGFFVALSESKAFAIGCIVFGGSFAALFLIQAAGRLQVCENGIWQYVSLLRWSKIRSYRWADDSTLLVRAKGFRGLFPTVALPVSPEQRQAVADVLAAHCSVQPGAESVSAAD